MRRDMELVRGILLGIEELDMNGRGCSSIELWKYLSENGYAYKKLSGHSTIMREAGLIEFEHMVRSLDRTSPARGVTLTWAGHEFLDNVRDQKAWKQVKKKIGANSISFEVLKTVAAEIAKGLIS